MDNSNRGKVVMVTGASAGVGRAVVNEFGRQGAHIGLVARGKERLEAARREIEESGGKAVVLPADVADTQQVEAAVDLSFFSGGVMGAIALYHARARVHAEFEIKTSVSPPSESRGRCSAVPA